MFGYFSSEHAHLQGYVMVYGDKRVTAVSTEGGSFPSYRWSDKVCVGQVDGSVTWEDLERNKIPNPHLNKFPAKVEYSSQRFVNKTF